MHSGAHSMNVLRVAAVVAVMLVFSVIGRATDFFQSVSLIGLAASSSYFDSSRNTSGNATLDVLPEKSAKRS